jgi:hypothetical protein
LQDDHQLDATVLKPALDQHILAEPWMEPVVNTSLNQVFVGSMSAFRAAAVPHADFRSYDKLM